MNWKDVQHPYVTPSEIQAEGLPLKRVNTSVSQYHSNLTNFMAVCAVTSLAGGKLSTTCANFQQLLLSKKYVLNY